MVFEQDAYARRETRVVPVRFDVNDLDPSIRPQDDLDGFVNSRWRAAHPVPDEHSCWDCFSILGEISLRQQADIADAATRGEFGDLPAADVVADFWTSGLDTHAGRDPLVLREELSRIDAIDDAVMLAAHLRDAHRRGGDPLFRIDARPDFEAPEWRIAWIVPAPLGLPDRDDYFDDSAGGIARRDAYAVHVAAMLALSGNQAARARSVANEIVAFERNLAKSLWPRRDTARDIGQLYNPVTCEQADRVAPYFGWTAFFAATPATLFSLAQPQFHAAVDRLIEDAPIATWRAWLRYRTVDAAAAFMDAGWRAQHERFHGATLRGRRGGAARWKQALRVLNEHAGDAMGELYAARHGSAQTNACIRALVEELRSALCKRMRGRAWMGADTRARALEKLAAMKIKIGAPETWRDWSGLHTTRTGIYANVIAARAFERRIQLAACGRATDPGQWSLTPQTVNARYDPQRNELLVPLALLQPPLFAPEADAALNYGAIGAVIAHEMTHAFDDQGSRFDAEGRMRTWWTDGDRAQFESLAADLARVIARFRDADGEPVDARLTLGENIADFGGIAIAFDALEDALRGRDDPLLDSYSQRRRFFLSWATLWRQNLTRDERALRRRIDVHAPAAVRANAAAAHCSAFTAAFDCNPGDAMAIAAGERIDIW